MQLEFYRNWSQDKLDVIPVDDGAFELVFHIPCQWITPTGCAIYDNRPELCKRFNGNSRSVYIQAYCKLLKNRLKGEK